MFNNPGCPDIVSGISEGGDGVQEKNKEDDNAITMD
jgi:hypothetical protein